MASKADNKNLIEQHKELDDFAIHHQKIGAQKVNDAIAAHFMGNEENIKQIDLLCNYSSKEFSTRVVSHILGFINKQFGL